MLACPTTTDCSIKSTPISLIQLPKNTSFLFTLSFLSSATFPPHALFSLLVFFFSDLNYICFMVAIIQSRVQSCTFFFSYKTSYLFFFVQPRKCFFSAFSYFPVKHFMILQLASAKIAGERLKSTRGR